MLVASPVMAADLGSGLSVYGEMLANSKIASSKNTVSNVTTRNVQSNIDRAYLGVRYEASPIWSLNFKTEFRSVVGATNNVLRVKEANVEGRFSDALVVKLGSAELPLVTFEDNAWGHRYLMPGLAELNATMLKSNTADYGIHFSGAVDSMDSGMFDYAASVIQGGGYLNQQNNSSSHIDYELLGSYSYDNAIVTAGYRSGYNGVAAQASANKRYNFGLGYNLEDIGSFGAEYIRIDDRSGVTQVKRAAWSVYGAAPVADALSLVARYDRTDPNTAVSNDTADKYLVALEHTYNENVSVAFSYDYTKDKAANTKDWNVGVFTNVTF